MSKRLLLTILSASIILTGTYIAIVLAKGYRPTRQGIIQGTGLLAANSFPNGAQVYINGKLVTATDNTINLEPATYTVEIRKDGFIPWKKNLLIEKELVTQTNALLFPAAPSLTPLTYTGVQNVVPSPDGQKVVFYVATASAQQKNGLYVLDLTESLLSLQKGPRQIARETNAGDFQNAKVIWAPDSNQLLLHYEDRNLLLDPSKLNDVATMQDATFKLTRTLSEWEQEIYRRERTQLQKFPEEIQRIATQSAKNIFISPDDERMLYTATTSVTLEQIIVPPVPAANAQPQERSLQIGGMYVYDRKEDTNFRIGYDERVIPTAFETAKQEAQQKTATSTAKKKTTKAIASPTPTPQLILMKQLLADDLYTQSARTLEASPSAFVRLQGQTIAQTAQLFALHYSGVADGTYQWLPDSKHLLIVKDNAVVVIEYDGTNETAVYAGPFSGPFVYPWPNGSQLIILANFGQPQAITNMYAVTLKN